MVLWKCSRFPTSSNQMQKFCSHHEFYQMLNHYMIEILVVTGNIPTSDRGTTKKSTSNPGGFWSAWRVTAWLWWLRSQWGKAFWWIFLCLQTRKIWLRMWRLAAVTNSDGVQDPERGNRTNSRITALGFKKADFGLFRNLLGRIPWENILERGKLVDFQESCLPPSSRMVHSNQQEIKQRWQD